MSESPDDPNAPARSPDSASPGSSPPSASSAESIGGSNESPRAAADREPQEAGTVVVAELVAVEAPLVSVPKVGHPVIAWIAIAALVAAVLALGAMAPSEPEETADFFAQWQSSMTEFQTKYLVNASRLPGASGDTFLRQAESLNRGTVENRLRFVALAGELGGPERGSAFLEDLRRQLEGHPQLPTGDQRRLIDALEKTYRDYESEEWSAPSVTADERKLIEQQLGWNGRLALTPKDSPNASMRDALLNESRHVLPLAFASALLILGIAGLALIGGGVYFVLMIYGRLHSRIRPAPKWGGVYAETFAVWMSLHLVLSLLASLAAALKPEWMIEWIAVSSLLGFAAILWPWLRAVPWRPMTIEIGLARPRSIIKEMAFGVSGWVSTLPFLFLSVIATIVIANGILAISGGEQTAADPFEPTRAPVHPIVEWAQHASWVDKLWLVALACVLAPVIEEIMFRGFLFRQLREATSGWRVASSVAASGLVSSFVFAVIHPQGWFGVLPLMTLAMAFSLLREWRGSLVAPMTAHAVNNGMAMLVLLTFFS